MVSIAFCVLMSTSFVINFSAQIPVKKLTYHSKHLYIIILAQRAIFTLVVHAFLLANTYLGFSTWTPSAVKLIVSTGLSQTLCVAVFISYHLIKAATCTVSTCVVVPVTFFIIAFIVALLIFKQGL